MVPLSHWIQPPGYSEQRGYEIVGRVEQYPADPKTTPSALYMKGLTLKKQNKKTEAAVVFRDVVRQYAHSDEAPEATAQLHSMGASTSATTPTKKSPLR